jgi:hypothetical protein
MNIPGGAGCHLFNLRVGKADDSFAKGVFFTHLCECVRVNTLVVVQNENLLCKHRLVLPALKESVIDRRRNGRGGGNIKRKERFVLESLKTPTDLRIRTN